MFGKVFISEHRSHNSSLRRSFVVLICHLAFPSFSFKFETFQQLKLMKIFFVFLPNSPVERKLST